MGFYENLAAQSAPITVAPESTSYFSESNPGLDPRLFRSEQLIGTVRQDILGLLFNHLKAHYYNPEAYTHAWLAGSGVSFQWAAQRDPADLDCLVGIDYNSFRRANSQYVGFSDQEIADTINDDLRTELWPQTSHYLGVFELTFYVNVASDIRQIKPYAAYSLTDDDWVVEPQIMSAPTNKKWEQLVDRDLAQGTGIVDRYTKALTAIEASKNDAARLNAQSALKLAVQQGAALFDAIHSGRSLAFSKNGLGYEDYANYRWQSGKASGLIPALKTMKEISTKSRQEFESQTYGMTLPDVKILIRRALRYNN